MRSLSAPIRLVTASSSGGRICARYRLSDHEKEDVAQAVWVLLVERIGKLRQPEMLGGWLATTTAHECLRVLRARG